MISIAIDEQKRASGAAEVHPDYALVRKRVALLNVSAEGRWRISGENALQALNALFSLDLEIVPRWQGVSGLFLREDASVLAIATIFRSDQDWYVFTEAVTAVVLHDYLHAGLDSAGVQIMNLADSHDWFCVVGPDAQAAMAAAAGDDILGMRYFSFEQNLSLGLPVFRMGFCGEYEYRILCPREKSGELAPRLLDAGREFGIACADPAVFPLLMLEMRSLSKADIPSAGNPVTLGMHCMVSFRKQDYPGSRVLQLSKRDPVSRTLMLRFEQTGVACAGDRLVIDSVDVGFCANVYFSPTLGQDIGLACVDPAFGWVGVPFTVIGKHGVVDAVGVSAPLFVTKTVSAA